MAERNRKTAAAPVEAADGERKRRAISTVSETDAVVKSLREDMTKASKGEYSRVTDDKGALPGSGVLYPRWNAKILSALVSQSSILPQCIDAMTTNVFSYGGYLEYVGPEGEKEAPESVREYEHKNPFIDQPNPDESLTDILEKLGSDYFRLGRGYLEVTRDIYGQPRMIHYGPAPELLFTARDPNPVYVSADIRRGGKIITLNVPKKFKRFLQETTSGSRTWFREFGDPRVMDPRSGAYGDVAFDNSATEILEYANASDKPYAEPLWIGQIMAVKGSIEAEAVNFDFFKNNAVPAMYIMISGGELSTQSLEELEAQFLGRVGRESMNRIVILEAMADKQMAGVDEKLPIPKLEIQPMIGQRQGDGTFREYDKDNREKIRSAFRLHPIAVGLSSDYSHATARSAFETMEGQVFKPERRAFEEVFNAVLRPFDSKDGARWRFRLRGAPLSSSADIIDAVRVLNESGAITPNIARDIVGNRLLGFEIPATEDAWGDLPYELVKQLKAFGGQDQVDAALDAAAAEVIQAADPEVAEAVKEAVRRIADGVRQSLKNGAAADQGAAS
jgi:PBSX family phage portal protein